jgi:predicted outer membrane repeat protein
MLSFLFPRVQRGSRSGQTGRLPAGSRRAFRPLLETLEGRCVPSVLQVTSTADDVNQPGTLRFEVAHAHSGDTILLTPAVKSGITLTHGELFLNQNLTIEATGTPATISGDNLSRIFSVAPGAQVTLSDLKLVNGNGVANNPSDPSGLDNNGGAILNEGSLTILGSVLSGNSAHDGGGAILTDGGTLTIDGSLLSGNSTDGFGGTVNGFGGAIWNFQSTLTIDNSRLLDNSAFAGGGAVINEGVMTIRNSSLVGNTAFEGGAIMNFQTLTVTGCAFGNNSAAFGGALFAEPGTTAVITGSVFTGNSASGSGGAIFTFDASAVQIGTSFFFLNTPNAITGGFTDLGGNVGI